MKILLVVAAAIINPQNEVLLAQRPKGKRLAGEMANLPGGKVEADESPEQALVRELHEELGIVVNPKDVEPFWFLSHDYVAEFGFHLLMPVYLCRRWQGKPEAKEHADLSWKHPRDMHQLSMIEADAALVEKLREVC